MSDIQQLLVLEEEGSGSDEGAQQKQVQTWRRGAPIALVVASVLTVSVAISAGRSRSVVPSTKEITLLSDMPHDQHHADHHHGHHHDPMAGADPHTEQAKNDIQHKDKNGDGKLTLQEHMDDDESFQAQNEQYQEMKKQFEEWDKNKDGMLDLQELIAGQSHGHGGDHGGHGPPPGEELGGHNAKYVKGAKGSNHGCDQAHDGPAILVEDEQHCRDAATQWSYTFASIGSWKPGYRGCVVNDKLKKVWLNQHPNPDGTRDPANYGQVCEKM